MKFHKIFFILSFLFLITSLSLAQENSFDTSVELYNNNLYSIAHQKFLTVVNTSDNLNIIEQSYNYAALCSFNLGNYKTAITEFTTLLINYPNSYYNKDAKYYILLSYFYLNNYAYTLKNLKNYLLEYPEENTNITLELLMAKSYFYIEHYDKALELFNKLNNYDNIPIDTKTEIKFFIAQIYYKNQNYSDATKLFYSILEISKNDYLRTFSYFYLGTIYFLQNDLKKSKDNFELCLESKSNNPKIKQLAKLYLNIFDKNIDANSLQNMLVTIKETKIKSYIILLLIEKAYKNSDYTKMNQYLKSGLQLNYYNDIYYAYYNRYYLKQDNTESCKYFLLKIINEYPESSFYLESIYNYGLISYQQKDLITANSFLEKIINSTNANNNLANLTLYYLSKIAIQQNNNDKSIKYLNQLFQSMDENFSHYDECINLLSDLYFHNNQYQELIQFLSSKTNFNNELKFKLASSYYNMKMFQKALNLCTYILDNNNNPLLYYNTFLLLKDISFALDNLSLIKKYLPDIKSNKYMNNTQLVDILVDISQKKLLNNKYQDIIDDMLLAITYQPDSTQKQKIDTLLYQSYKNLKLYDKALETLNHLIEVNPNDEKLLEEKQQILKLSE